MGGLGDGLYRARVVRRFWWKALSQLRSGGGRGHPGDLVRDVEAVGHLVAPSGGRQQMPTRAEMWRDAAERGQEPLRMPGLRCTVSSPARVAGMRVLGPVEF